MHALGFDQTTPLHIHRTTHEATIVVSGTAHVTQVHGEGDKLVSEEHDFAEGTLIHSPPFVGHEWMNPSHDHFLGNLVFAAPPFDGNFYLKPLDTRMLRSSAGPRPYAVHPVDQLAAFEGSREPYRLSALPGMGTKLALLFVRGEYALPAQPWPTLLYAVLGHGAFAATSEHAIAPQTLTIVPAKLAGKLASKPGTTLALIVLRPEA
jgi:hypothetical protein